MAAGNDVKIRVGVVGRAHGVRGALRVFPDDPESDSLFGVKEVYLGESGEAWPIVRAVRCGRFVALELEGVTDRDQAFSHTGEVVSVVKEALKPLRHAYYACDLVGLRLRDAEGREWGVVRGVIPGSAHDLLEYERTEGGTGYVPFVSAHVGKVDISGGTIEVDGEWMSSLDGVYGD